MADGSAFSRMESRIAAMPQDEFAGAVVIVPPGEEKGIEFATSDPSPDIVQFWATVKSRVEIAYAEALGNIEGARGYNR